MALYIPFFLYKINLDVMLCVFLFIHIVLLSLMDDGLQYWQYLFTVHTGFGWVGGAAGLTGLTLLAILLIMVIFSLPIVRNKGFFQACPYLYSVIHI